MMEVFPTPWSPKNTNLYFANGEILGPVEEVAWELAGADAPFDEGAAADIQQMNKYYAV